MPAEPPRDFGSRLRAARERRGRSLQQVADATKISVHTLEALERNDLGRLPGGIFTRSFVRSYALEVGLDPDEAVEQFLTALPPRDAAAGHRSVHDIEDNDSIESERRIASTVLTLAVLSIPLAALIVYFGAAGRRPAPDAVNGASVPTATTGREPAARDIRLSVEIVATGSCLVNAVVDGEPTAERFLVAGERRTFDAAQSLQFMIGDAGAVAWTVNGEPGRPLGAPGQPVRVDLTTANIKDYLAPR
jgi:transcriptional regulator with XRE-family HTH domain